MNNGPANVREKWRGAGEREREAGGREEATLTLPSTPLGIRGPHLPAHCLSGPTGEQRRSVLFLFLCHFFNVFPLSQSPPVAC